MESKLQSLSWNAEALQSLSIVMSQFCHEVCYDRRYVCPGCCAHECTEQLFVIRFVVKTAQSLSAKSAIDFSWPCTSRFKVSENHMRFKKFVPGSRGH